MSEQAANFACDGCKYLGHEYKHLQGVHGVKTWVQCNYPLPFYVVPSATPMVEGTCKTHTPKGTLVSKHRFNLERSQ